MLGHTQLGGQLNFSSFISSFVDLTAFAQIIINGCENALDLLKEVNMKNALKLLPSITGLT